MDVRATLDHLLGATRMFTLVNQGQAVGEDAAGIAGDEPVVALTNAGGEPPVVTDTGAFDGDRTSPSARFPPSCVSERSCLPDSSSSGGGTRMQAAEPLDGLRETSTTQDVTRFRGGDIACEGRRRTLDQEVHCGDDCRRARRIQRCAGSGTMGCDAARKSGSRVVAVHSESWTELWSLSAFQVNVDSVLAELQELLDGHWSAPLRKTGIEFTTKPVRGDPATELLRVAKPVRASMLVLGSRSHSSLADLIVGGMVHKVINRSTIPVMLVPAAPL